MSKKTKRTNLGNVVRFEIIRNLKKPTFWIAALILPALLIGYIAFAGFTGYNAGLAAEEGTDTSNLKLGIHDAADYLQNRETIILPDGTAQTIAQFESKEQGIEALQNGIINIFYYIPADFDESFTAEIYTRTEAINIFTNFEIPLRTMLAATASLNVEPVDFMVISGNIQISTTNFTIDNTEVDMMAQISQMIIPGLGLILFYILIVVLSNRLTNAMVEEKENRISEMILTSLNPKDLITGKIVSLIILGFIQLAMLILPIIILAIFGMTQDIIPVDFFIEFNAWTIISTLVLLVASFFLFTSLCVAIGTLVPTAKDAGQFASVVIILTIMPLFFIDSFMATSNANTITHILSYFPPSAPIALMFRNTFGTLSVHEYFIGLAIIVISSALIIKFAVYVYSRTAIEFSNRISLKKLLSSPRKNWK